MARARFVEQLGFESVWLPDLQFGDGTPGVEAVTALGVLAGAAERVRLGFATLVLPPGQGGGFASVLGATVSLREAHACFQDAVARSETARWRRS